MGSPYPLSYDLAWPWLHVRPSIKQHAPLVQRPLAHTFVPHARADVASIVCFGDLMGLTRDRVPEACESLRELLAGADLIIGNCESPVTHDEKDPRAFYLQRFRMASAYLREVFDRFAIDPTRTVLSVANNHIGDQGADGERETADRLMALGVTPAGLKSGGAPLVTRAARGLRVGICAFTEWLNRPACAIRTADAIEHDWPATREALALDTLLAAPHWEWEFQHFPAAATIALAQRLAVAGFDAIAGHHPHVVQPIAWFGPTVCQFSLGNLFARTLAWPHRLITVLELHVATGGPQRGRVVGYCSHPFVQLDTRRGPRLATISAAPPRLRERVRDRLARIYPDG
jgi:hypothetical protein